MSNGLVILAYHRVLESRDELRPSEVTAQDFDRHMRVVSNWFNVLPLRQGVARLKSGSLPRRAVCITFDDGYADNYSVALPLLRKYDLPATVFVATGFLDGGRMWNDTIIEAVRRWPDGQIDLTDLQLGCYPTSDSEQRRVAVEAIIRELKHRDPAERLQLVDALAKRSGESLPDDLMLTSEQVSELSKANIEIGAHTVTHPILKSTTDQAAEQEISVGKATLESITGKPVKAFAYPNGKPGVDYDPVHVEMVNKAGFDCAVATCSGIARQADDVFQLPRFGPWAESSIKFGLRTLRMFLRQ